MIECESYAAGHSIQTARENYVSSNLAMMKSRMAHTRYREMIGIPEDQIEGPEGLELDMGDAQGEESAKNREEEFKRKKDDFMAYKKKLNKTKLASTGRSLTDNERVAMFHLIDECDRSHRHPVPISNKGQDVVELFLGSKRCKVKDISLHKTLLRMIDMCPEDSEPRNQLQDHLVLRCRLKSNTVDMEKQDLAIRQLELGWTESLLKSLDNMRANRASKAVSNEMILDTLEKVARRKNSLNYTLGDKGIRDLVEESLREGEKRAGQCRPQGVQRVGPKEYHGAVQEKLNKLPPVAHSSSRPDPHSASGSIHPVPSPSQGEMTE